MGVQIINRWFLRGKIPYLVITLFVAVVYSQTLFFGYSSWDDNLLILENSYWLSDISNFWQSFRHDVYRVVADTPTTYFYYRPLLTLSFMLDAQWGRMSAASFHFTNIVIHLFAVFLLFIFLQKLKYSKELAFLGALFFLVHPALASAVAAIPGRNDSLLALFALASFIFFIEYVDHEKMRDGCFSLLFLFLALLAKETALVLVVLFWFYLRYIAGKKLSLASRYLLLGGETLVVIIWFYLRQAVGSHMLSPSLPVMLKALKANWPAFIQSLGKALFPFNLSVAPSVCDTPLLYGWLAVLTLLCLVYFTKVRRYNFVLFGLLWSLVFLLPTQVIFYPFQPEHRLYLPIMGIMILLLETDLIGRLRLKGWAGMGIAAVLCLFLIINITHAWSYRDRLTFWRAAARTSPSSAMVHVNLGLAYYDNGLTDEALAEYGAAGRINPGELDLHNGIGLLHMSQKRWGKAEVEFNREVALWPDNDLAFYNLGILYVKMDRPKQAAQYWKQSLAVNPERVFAYRNLAYYYYLTNDLEQFKCYADQLKTRGIRLDIEQDIDKAGRKLRERKL